MNLSKLCLIQYRTQARGKSERDPCPLPLAPSPWVILWLLVLLVRTPENANPSLSYREFFPPCTPGPSNLHQRDVLRRSSTRKRWGKGNACKHRGKERFPGHPGLCAWESSRQHLVQRRLVSAPVRRPGERALVSPRFERTHPTSHKFNF